jgi:hypothetical protein
LSAAYAAPAVIAFDIRLYSVVRAAIGHHSLDEGAYQVHPNEVIQNCCGAFAYPA